MQLTIQRSVRTTASMIDHQSATCGTVTIEGAPSDGDEQPTDGDEQPEVGAEDTALLAGAGIGLLLLVVAFS